MRAGVTRLVNNSGQSRNAPTRMLWPAARLAQAERGAKQVADAVVVGDPRGYYVRPTGFSTSATT